MLQSIPGRLMDLKSSIRFLSATMTITLILLTLSCSGTQSRRDEIRREGELHLQMGSNYLNKGKIELALFELTKAARLLPKNPDVHFALGTVHLLREEPELAVEEFKKTVEIDDRHADAYNNLGYAYLKLQMWDEAIMYCQKALDEVTYDTPERAMTIIGWAYYKKGDSVRALDMLKRALHIKDNQPDTENRIATIYLEEGRIDKARSILVDLVKDYPGFANARLNLGIVYYKERDLVAAKREFRSVLELVDRDSEEARLARGYLDLIE
jgi:Tfp pilus assembly protein PilF